MCWCFSEQPFLFQHSFSPSSPGTKTGSCLTRKGASLLHNLQACEAGDVSSLGTVGQCRPAWVPPRFAEPCHVNSPFGCAGKEAPWAGERCVSCSLCLIWGSCGAVSQLVLTCRPGDVHVPHPRQLLRPGPLPQTGSMACEPEGAGTGF